MEIARSLSIAPRIFQLLNKASPNLVVIDLHSPEAFIDKAIQVIHRKFPQTQLLFNAQHLDLDRELEVKKNGPSVFLRDPFTEARLERAIVQANAITAETRLANQQPRTVLPKIKTPVQFKIILPYLVLAFILAIGAGYLVSRITLDAIENRFNNNLIEVGRLSAAWMVEEENRRLESLRLMANIDGLADSIQSGNSESTRKLVYGLMLNSEEEAGVRFFYQRHALFQSRFRSANLAGTLRFDRK